MLVRVQQIAALLRVLVRYRQLYIHGTNELRALLGQTDTLLPPAGPAHCSLRELRRSLLELKVEFACLPVSPSLPPSLPTHSLSPSCPAC